MTARKLQTKQAHPTNLSVFPSLLVLGAAAWFVAAKSAENPATNRISVSASGAQADAESTGPVVSGDGRYIAFVSWALNLVPSDWNNCGDIFVKDRQTGGIVRASVSTSGVEANGESYAPAISADGRYVAFVSEASNLVSSDTNEVADVFVRDLVQGTTVRASVASSGTQANASSTNPAVSSNGRFVAFESGASNFDSTDTNGDEDIFVRDLVSSTTERVSLSNGGGQAIGASQSPSISADGRFVAFASAAANLVSSPADTNKAWDVFVRDRNAVTTVRASLSSSGTQASGNSIAPSISADGRFVAFESKATDLVPGDTNGRADVFVRDLQDGTTAFVSISSSGALGNQASIHPSISGDGRFVAFASKASNLTAGDTNQAQDVFLRDRSQGTTLELSVGSGGGQAQGGSLWPALSADGRFVVFACDAGNLVSADSNSAADVFLRGPLF
jgi:Tol biopolymer transport system component